MYDIKLFYTPRVFEPVEPGALEDVGDDFEVSASHGVARFRRHLVTTHVPLRLQQRLDHVLAPTTNK